MRASTKCRIGTRQRSSRLREAGPLPGRSLEIRQTAKLRFDLSQDAPGQGLERPNQSSVVDRAALIDHNLAVLSVPSHPSGNGYAKEILTGETCRAGQHPGRWMPCLIQQVGLNDENGPELSSFGAPSGAEIGEVEESPADLHHSSRPSEASPSSSANSCDSAGRVAFEARR